MARPTLNTHPKFAKLVGRLRATPCAAPAAKAIALGALELLWHSGYAEGEATIGNAEAVEAVAEWLGTAGVLASHLVAAGFLDLADADLADARGIGIELKASYFRQAIANLATLGTDVPADAPKSKRQVKLFQVDDDAEVPGASIPSMDDDDGGDEEAIGAA